MARAEQFRRNKASKDNADEMPASSKEGQKETQSSVSSRESALENPPSATAVLGKGPSDPTDDAENQNSLSVSRVKRKAKRRQDKRKNATVNEKPEATAETSEMSAAHVEAQVLDNRGKRHNEPHHGSEEPTPPKRQWTQEDVEWLLDELEKRIKDDHDDSELFDDLARMSSLIKKFRNGTRSFLEGKGDEGQRILASFEQRIQYIVGEFHRKGQPRARANSVSSYKGRVSAKSQKGKKR